MHSCCATPMRMRNHTHKFLSYVNSPMLVDITRPFILAPLLALGSMLLQQWAGTPPPIASTQRTSYPRYILTNKCLPSLLSQCTRESLLLLHHDVAAGTVRSSIIFTFINLNPLHFHQRHRSWRRGRSARSLYVNAVFTSRALMSRLHWHQHWHSTLCHWHQYWHSTLCHWHQHWHSTLCHITRQVPACLSRS